MCTIMTWSWRCNWLSQVQYRGRGRERLLGDSTCSCFYVPQVVQVSGPHTQLYPGQCRTLRRTYRVEYIVTWVFIIFARYDLFCAVRLDTQVKLYRLLGLELQYWDARKLLNWDTVPLPLDVCLRLCSVAEYSEEEAGKVNSKILQHYSLFGLFHTLVNCEWKFIVR